ncbi:cation/H(+) antiporter 15-like [Hordeum vulgare]|uniref:Cation/H+ exchanger domain-containing protein n=1 Tax=Hordeum vulgare subsp. vulgare TaxID=112509 RepID=A0A8I6WW54_HORVV|nr:cation/H(+) antiporter 15-like [Hordeum vulgare]
MDKVDCYVVPQTTGTSRNIFQGGSPLSSSLPLLGVQLVLIVSVTRVLYFVFKPLKQPRVVSEIMGGIILGPSLLCRYEGFKQLVFPARGEPVLNTVATFGLMYVIFLIGVRMDPMQAVRSGKKGVTIGLSGFLLALALTAAGCSGDALSEEEDMSMRFTFLFALTATLSVTSFAVLSPILSELSLLNSDLGRIAMSASMTTDGIAWLIMVGYVLAEAYLVSPATSLWAFISVAALVAFILLVVRPIALLVIERTPAGSPVDEAYVFFFLLIVLLVGLYSDIIGTNSFHGALMLGLAIPDGPPLGTALGEKIEAMVTGLILPLYYTMTGLSTDMWEVHWGRLQLVLLLGWFGKFAGVLASSLLLEIPALDAVSLSLFMNSKGIVEVITFSFFLTNKLIDKHMFSALVFSSVALTAVSVPVASLLYDPARRYAVYKRRTVQHLKADADLRILACIHDESHVQGTLSLLEASYATPNTPVALCLLQLVEIAGRSAPVFIPHKLRRSASSRIGPTSSANAQSTDSDRIINAFLQYEQRHPEGAVSMQSFTTISPYSSMHDEVCRLAVDKRTSLILLHYHKRHMLAGGMRAAMGLRVVNRKVLEVAPCSVGVFVDRNAGSVGLSAFIMQDHSVSSSSGGRPSGLGFHAAVAALFFGGGDDREALAYVTRMARHPGSKAAVIRFLPTRGIKDDPADRRVDNKAIEEVKSLSARSKYMNLQVQEELVGDMEKIVEVLRGLDKAGYDLVIVGMRHRWYPVMSANGLSDWSECPELGVIGDLLASSDFDTPYSVLIMKQQDQGGLNAAVPGAQDVWHGDDGAGAPAPERTMTTAVSSRYRQ